MQQLSEEEWKDHIVYLTRERPKTSINGLGGYLTKITQPFDREDIKQAYGGNEFSYIMKKKNDLIYSGNFPVEAPPKFDPTRENAGGMPASVPVATGADAQTFAKELIGILREEIGHLREGAQSTAGGDAAVDMLVKASEKAMAIVEKQTPQASSPAAMMTEMIKAMKEMGIVGAPTSGKSTLGSLIEEVTPLVTLLMPVLGKFFTPSNPLEQATQFMALMDKVDALRGKGGPSRGTTTNDLILEGIKELPNVIRTLQAEKQTAQRPGAQIRQFPQPAPSFPQPTPPAAAHPIQSGATPLRVTPIHGADAAARNGDQTNTEQPNAEQPSNVATSAEDWHTAWVKRNIVEMFAMGQDAEKIAVFIDLQKPDLAHDLGNYDLKSIVGMIATDPILQQVTQIPFYELKIEAIRTALIEMASEEAELNAEELAEAAKVN